MAQKHYHVGHNMPGYSADEVYAVTTKKEAISAVADEARRYRESELDIPRRDRRTGSGSAASGRIYFSRPGDSFDLGYIYWWSGPCWDTDCVQPGEEW
jgi:hypothetical protein